MNDSIERIKEDSLKFVEQYWNCANVFTCEKCPSKIGEQKPYEYYETFSCSGAMQINLINRAVKVMDSRMERTCILEECGREEKLYGHFYDCSNCGYELPLVYSLVYNYCPNCGSKVVN